MISALIDVVNENENFYHLTAPMQSPRVDYPFRTVEKENEALVAATLALMTVYAERHCAAAARKICDNLLHLSASASVPWELRVVVAKLGARWALLCDAIPDRPAGAGGTAPRHH